MTNTKDPVLEYSEASFRVAMSDHADFPGTLEYVKATGAQYVVTDNTRAGHAVLLAQEIQRRLGIRARPSANRPSNDWGV
jgi:Cft2 family RNA processing exonuclease